jgi:hypothetical protein
MVVAKRDGVRLSSFLGWFPQVILFLQAAILLVSSAVMLPYDVPNRNVTDSVHRTAVAGLVVGLAWVATAIWLGPGRPFTAAAACILQAVWIVATIWDLSSPGKFLPGVVAVVSVGAVATLICLVSPTGRRHYF